MIGKWNKSVILTYLGLACAIGGILVMRFSIPYAIIFMVLAGICDLFDGFVARKCKRTEEEKNFGIELDSLVDVVSFGVFPVMLFISMGYTAWYHALLYILYVVMAIARLAYFNIGITDNSKPVSYYTGLPVTFASLIFPLGWLLSFVLKAEYFELFYSFLMLLVTILFVSKIKIKKPGGVFYLLFSLMAVMMIIFCLVKGGTLC